MLKETLNDRERAFLMVSLLADPSHAEELIKYLPPHQHQPLTRALGELKPKTKEARRQLIIDELKSLVMESRRSPLADIHTDWIVEALAKEAPRTIATILRHLPGDRVRSVLEALPDKLLGEMPPLMETFSLDSELVQILRRRFEQNFVFHLSEAEVFKEGSFNAVSLLSAIKLELLFRDLGFRELAMAFTTMNEKTIDLVLSRLPARDSALLKTQLGKKEPVGDERLKQAQSHLLSLDLEKGAIENMIMELGFFVYSKAVLPVHLEGARVIQQKFSIKLGKLLKRYIERNLPLNSENTVRRYQDEVLEVAGRLGDEETGNRKQET